MIKHYIKYFFPGFWRAESQIQEIAERNSNFEVPFAAYAYQFLDRDEAIIDGELIIGDWENESPRFFYGTEYTLEEVKANFPDHTPFVAYMECNRWNRVVETRHGLWRPLGENDIVLDS